MTEFMKKTFTVPASLPSEELRCTTMTHHFRPGAEMCNCGKWDRTAGPVSALAAAYRNPFVKES